MKHGEPQPYDPGGPPCCGAVSAIVFYIESQGECSRCTCTSNLGLWAMTMNHAGPLSSKPQSPGRGLELTAPTDGLKSLIWSLTHSNYSLFKPAKQPRHTFAHFKVPYPFRSKDERGQQGALTKLLVVLG